MAEQPFLVGNKARELLRYTQRATRIVSDDISRSDARKVFQKAAALEDIREMKQVCTTAVHALDVREKEGFTPCAASTPTVWKNCSTAQFPSTEKSTRINSHETGDAPGNAAASTRSSTKP